MVYFFMNIHKRGEYKFQNIQWRKKSNMRWDFLLAKQLKTQQMIQVTKKLQFTSHLGKWIAAWVGSKLDINDAY